MIIGVDAVAITCWRCKCEYALPVALYQAAKASERINFYCPYGHEAHYPAGETNEDKLRRERDRLAQRLVEKDDAIKFQREQREKAERQLSATKGVVTKIKKRVGNGVCPCCNRSFHNVARHMQSEHPEWTAEAAE